MPYKKYFYDTTIQEHDLDSFGHLNNAVYLRLFEAARWEILTQNGMGFKEIQKTQKGPVILEVNLRFNRELKARQKVSIQSQILSYTRKVAELEQKMMIGETVHATAVFKMGFFDMQERKLILPTPEWLKAIGWVEE